MVEYENYPGQDNPTPGEPRSSEHSLVCTVCSGVTFRSEAGRLQGVHGFSSHVLQLFICTNCGYAHVFYRPDASGF